MDQATMRQVYTILAQAGPDGFTADDVIRLANDSDTPAPAIDRDTAKLAMWALFQTKKAMCVPDRHGIEIHMVLVARASNRHAGA